MILSVLRCIYTCKNIFRNKNTIFGTIIFKSDTFLGKAAYQGITSSSELGCPH